MSINYNPAITTDGLVLCFDAGNVKSYPGSGTTWTDLSGNGNILTSTGTVTYSSLNNGYFTFPGTAGNYYGADTVNFSSSSFDRTIICWFWPDSTGPASDYTGLVKIGNGSDSTPSDSILLCLNTVNATTWGVASAYWINDYDPGTSLPVVKDSWNMAAIIARSSTSTNNTTLICGNINGFNSLTGSSSNYTRGLQNVNTNFRIGCTDTGGTRPMKGRIAKVEFYNRILTIAEIQQNFNTSRVRFGI